MGKFKDLDIDNIEDWQKAIDEFNQALATGIYDGYDGGDETEECRHKNVREIHLLTTTIKECTDCGKELK
jgi:hypothetical protein